MGDPPEALPGDTTLSGDAFEIERRRLQRIARGLLFGEHDAEDAVQEAWLTLLRPEGSRPRSTQAWLTATVRRLASTRRREDERRRRRERNAARGEREPGAAQVAARLEVLRRVLDAVEALDEPYRHTIVRRFLDDQPPRAIAREDGVPVATVRTRVRRGLAQLRRELDGEDQEGRARFLGALAPLAGRAPWELGPLGGIAQTVTQTGGTLVVKEKLGVVAAGLVALALLGGLGWLALGPGAGGGRGSDASVQPSRAELAAPAAPEGLSSDDDAQGRIAARVDGAPRADWVVRGVVTLAKRELMPGAPLALQLSAGPTSDGEVVAEGRVRADDAGTFEWAIPAPEQLATLTIGFAGDEHTTTFNPLVVPAGEEAPRDLLVIVHPTDVTVVGRVLDPGGAPVAGARVMSYREETHSARDGTFRLRGSSAAGVVQGRVVAAGYEVGRFHLTLRSPGQARVDDLVLRRAVELRGRLTDAAGAPVADAVISSWPYGELSVRSDADGRFVASWFASGGRSPWLRARAAGFCDQGRAVSDEELATGELDWTLERGAPVSGVVRDADGRPLGGARVVAAGSPDQTPRVEVWSRADGSFELPRLPAGEETLWALRRGHRSARLPIVVPPPGDGAEHALAGLELVLGRGHFLAGRVIDDDGAPVPFAHVYFDDRRREHHVPRHDADAQGRFRVDDLPEGPLRLGFLRRGYLRHEQRFDELDRDGLVVRMTRAGALAGRVVDGLTGEPIDSFRIRFAAPTLAPGEAGVYGYWVGWSSDGPGVPFVGTAGVWSTASAEDLTLGAVTGVEALADGYAPSLVDRVVVQAEPDPDALVIELFAADASVHGQVVSLASGAPVAGARVRAFRGRPGPSSPDDGAVVTDAAGRFELLGLALGNTALVVDHPDFARALDGPFQLRSGDRLARHVELDSGAYLVGRLLGGDGAPLPGEALELYVRAVENAGRRSWELVTDSAGAFRFDGLLPGEYQLSWMRAFGAASTQVLSRLVVVPADAREVTADLRPRGGATVRCTLDGLDDLSEPVHLYLRPVVASIESDEEHAEYVARLRAGMALDGTCELEHVEPGDYVVEASSAGFEGSAEVRVPDEGVVPVRIARTGAGR